MRSTCPAHRMILCEEYKVRNSYYFLSFPDVPPLGSSILLSTLLSDVLVFVLPIRLGDRFHTYRKRDTIIFIHVELNMSILNERLFFMLLILLREHMLLVLDP
jgi:hypothetical protein